MDIVPFGKTDLGPAAQALVEKISGAIGTAYAPFDKIFHALADVQVEKIKVAGRVEVDGVRIRALERLAAEETKKQQNLEAIYGKTFHLLEPQVESSTIDQIDNDWIVYHSETARLVADEDMQTLWAKILASEAAAPGSYSKRTLETLSVLEKSDAHLFTSLCRFVIRQDGEDIPAVFYLEGPPRGYPPIYRDRGIDNNSLIHLGTIGLVNYPGGLLQPNVRYFVTPTVAVDYFGECRRFTSTTRGGDHGGKYVIVFGHVDLTKVGRQLARISGAEPVEGFFDFLEGQWAIQLVARKM